MNRNPFRESPISRIIVTPEVQRLRIRNGCGCDGLTVTEDPITGCRKTEPYNMCPDGDRTLSLLGCEIFHDQKLLCAPLEELPCIRQLNGIPEEFKDLTLDDDKYEHVESLEAILEARQRLEEQEEQEEQESWG